MIYTIPTKKGLGIEIWGTRDDLEYLYDIVSRFWNDPLLSPVKGYEDKNHLISGFSHELRKASYGSRLIEPTAIILSRKFHIVAFRFPGSISFSLLPH